MNIVKIELHDIITKDKKRYNINNQFDMPSNYETVLQQTYFNKYKHLKSYKEIIIPIKSWMYDAHKISNITGKFPNQFIEELEEYITKYNILFDKEYFVRTENVSLKYGKKIYNNTKDIIIDIITSPNRHTPLNKKVKELILYLIEPVEIDKNLEFRVFVYNNKVTAISQQFIYQKNTIITDNNVLSICNKIVEYIYNHIIPYINHIKNYTIDLAIVNNNVYFIELNSYGAEYAAGSALFHWIIDKDILEGIKPFEFRYTI